MSCFYQLKKSVESIARQDFADLFLRFPLFLLVVIPTIHMPAEAWSVVSPRYGVTAFIKVSVVIFVLLKVFTGALASAQTFSLSFELPIKSFTLQEGWCYP